MEPVDNNQTNLVLSTRCHNFQVTNDAVKIRFEKQALRVYVSLLNVEARKSRACSSNVVGQCDIGRHDDGLWVTTKRFHHQICEAQKRKKGGC